MDIPNLMPDALALDDLIVAHISIAFNHLVVDPRKVQEVQFELTCSRSSSSTQVQTIMRQSLCIKGAIKHEHSDYSQEGRVPVVTKIACCLASISANVQMLLT